MAFERLTPKQRRQLAADLQKMEDLLRVLATHFKADNPAPELRVIDGGSGSSAK